MKRSKCVVIQGKERKETVLTQDTGIKLQYIPAGTFIEIYNSMPANNDVIKIADDYIKELRI